MTKKFVFIADFFSDEVPGGGELNNDELANLLIERGHYVLKLKSQNVSFPMLSAIESDGVPANFIISNFINLSEEAKRFFYGAPMASMRPRYVIYEHDHKYLQNRNPALYDNYIAPKSHIVNRPFYEGAKAIICQSEFHAKIVKANLGLDNIINIGGNLWSEAVLEVCTILADRDKHPMASIMGSDIEHKNTHEAIAYCKYHGNDYRVIKPCPHIEFLDKLGSNMQLVFLPKTPETLSRIVVEARMMGMAIATNGNVGACGEPWFKLRGKELIEEVRTWRQTIPDRVEEIFNG